MKNVRTAFTVAGSSVVLRETFPETLQTDGLWTVIHQDEAGRTVSHRDYHFRSNAETAYEAILDVYKMQEK